MLIENINFVNQESGIRNQESGIRNQESGIRNQESGIRNQESGIRNQRSIIPNLKFKSSFPTGKIQKSLENFNIFSFNPSIFCPDYIFY